MHDRQTGMTERVSLNSSSAQADNTSYDPLISADGRYVAFTSLATNLVPGDTNVRLDVFVRDRLTGTTTRVSVDSSGAQGNDESGAGSISEDVRFVAFYSRASNLVPGDTNLAADVFVHDRLTRTTTRVSVDSMGAEGNHHSFIASISADGRFVAFDSLASNLVPGDTNVSMDVFVHDRQAGTTERVSVDSTGAPGKDDSRRPSISADGRIVAFESVAINLVSGDTNSVSDVFVHDRLTGTTERVSVGSAGAQGNDESEFASISADGRFVAFVSYATNLVTGDTNQDPDVFVHDRHTGSTRRVSVKSDGGQGNRASYNPSISADGRIVAFGSISTNLVPGDTNFWSDAFVHGPYLTLEANPETVATGDAITLTTWTGLPGGASLLAVVDVNGTPLFVVMALGFFDADGLWTLTGTVPPGLSGNLVLFETLGIEPTGKVGISNEEAVTFQ